LRPFDPARIFDLSAENLPIFLRPATRADTLIRRARLRTLDLQLVAGATLDLRDGNGVGSDLDGSFRIAKKVTKSLIFKFKKES
jgi:hypothetical protein